MNKAKLEPFDEINTMPLAVFIRIPLRFIPSGANSSILLKIKVTALEQSKAIYTALA